MKRLSGMFVVMAMLFVQQATAQVNLKDSVVFAPIIDFGYTFQIPGADMAERFGINSSIGLAFYIKTRKNFFYGIDANYIFGSKVYETSIVEPFLDSQSGILGLAGLYAELQFLERGFNISGKFGKLFPVISPNKNSGIMLLAGVGYIMHRIKIIDRLNEVPMLTSDSYIAGYDRLTKGMMLSEFIGYRYLSTHRLINVFGGFEFIQGFTTSSRPVNYDTGEKGKLSRIDLLYGIKVGISLPLYKKMPNEYYYR